MKIIAHPKKESVVLSSVQKDAKVEEIQESIIANAESCVDSLCGCESSSC